MKPSFGGSSFFPQNTRACTYLCIDCCMYMHMCVCVCVCRCACAPGYSQVPGRAKPEQLQPVALPEDAARRLQPRSVAATGPAVRTIAASTPASTQWAPSEDPHEYPVSTTRDAGGFRPGRAEHACGESTTRIPLRCPRVPQSTPEYPRVPQSTPEYLCGALEYPRVPQSAP